MEIHDASRTISGVKERTGQISEEIADWATHVATLSPEYVKCAARQEPAESVRRRWVGHSDFYSCLMEGKFCYSLKQQPGGWVVHRDPLSLAASGPQILCNILGDMPILSPRFEAAALLAEACHLTPLAVMQWRTVHSSPNRALRPELSRGPLKPEPETDAIDYCKIVESLSMQLELLERIADALDELEEDAA